MDKKDKHALFADRTLTFAHINAIINFFGFFLKMTAGIFCNSFFLCISAMFNLCMGIVRKSCRVGYLKNESEIKYLIRYIRGGAVITAASIFYLAYMVSVLIFPTNFHYGLVTSIAVAAFSFLGFGLSIAGIVKTKGKHPLLKQIKLSNFGAACTNIALTQVALLSAQRTENAYIANGIMGIAVGIVIFASGIYSIADGKEKYRNYKNSTIK